jgi:histidine triad (HIT) family protein
MSCLFCRVVSGEVPATRVAESERTVAFRDLHPVAPTHVLVVPRDHIEHAAAIGPEHAATIAELFVTARQVAESEGIAARGYRLVFNVGEDSGNTVGHLHLHVVGGTAMGWPPFPRQ